MVHEAVILSNHLSQCSSIQLKDEARIWLDHDMSNITNYDVEEGSGPIPVLSCYLNTDTPQYIPTILNSVLDLIMGDDQKIKNKTTP